MDTKKIVAVLLDETKVPAISLEEVHAFIEDGMEESHKDLIPKKSLGVDKVTLKNAKSGDKNGVKGAMNPAKTYSKTHCKCGARLKGLAKKVGLCASCYKEGRRAISVNPKKL